jgi:hypothetical protein
MSLSEVTQANLSKKKKKEEHRWAKKIDGFIVQKRIKNTESYLFVDEIASPLPANYCPRPTPLFSEFLWF